MVGADHFRRRADVIYVAGWATWPVTVETPGAAISVEAQDLGTWKIFTIEATLVSITQIITITRITGTFRIIHIGPTRIDPRVVCALSTKMKMLGPGLIQAVRGVDT